MHNGREEYHFLQLDIASIQQVEEGDRDFGKKKKKRPGSTAHGQDTETENSCHELNPFPSDNQRRADRGAHGWQGQAPHIRLKLLLSTDGLCSI